MMYISKTHQANLKKGFIMKTSNRAPGSKAVKPDPGAEVIQITLTMPKRLLRNIDALADRRNISRAALVRMALSRTVEVA